MIAGEFGAPRGQGGPRSFAYVEQEVGGNVANSAGGRISKNRFTSPSTLVLSQPINFRRRRGQITVDISSGTLYVNGKPTGQTSVSVTWKDYVQVQATTSASFDTETVVNVFVDGEFFSDWRVRTIPQPPDRGTYKRWTAADALLARAASGTPISFP